MPLAKRIIACLDIKDGRTVKGVRFEQLKDAGDPVELATLYAEQGVDELVFLDITASVENRKTWPDLVSRIASCIDIPFTVGGGISSADDVAVLVRNGADKVSVNTAAFLRPSLISDISSRFGSQCVVVAIDVKKEQDGQWYVYLHGGRTATGITATAWAEKAVQLGAGEILLTSMDSDGTRSGFALDITKDIAARVPVPVIASGGAGEEEHFYSLFESTSAGAALAAGIFHDRSVAIPVLKQYLSGKGITVRTSKQ